MGKIGWILQFVQMDYIREWQMSKDPRRKKDNRMKDNREMESTISNHGWNRKTLKTVKNIEPESRLDVAV